MKGKDKVSKERERRTLDVVRHSPVFLIDLVTHVFRKLMNSRFELAMSVAATRFGRDVNRGSQDGGRTQNSRHPWCRPSSDERKDN